MRELWIRILTAVVGIPFVLWIIFQGGWIFFIAIEILIFGSTIELSALFKKMDIRPATIPVLATNLLLPFFFSPDPILSPLDPASLFAIFFISLLLTATQLLWQWHRNSALAIAASIFSTVYIGIPFALLVGLRNIFTLPQFVLSSAEPITGAYLTAALFVTIWVSDSAAYFAGRKFGKRKLAPTISPKKTWEGAIAGFIAAVISFVLCGKLLLPHFPLFHWLVLGTLVGIFGPIGDLTESLFKRKAGVKDSSHFFPGHGGFLDRFDSLLFCAPSTFFYAWFFF